MQFFLSAFYLTLIHLYNYMYSTANLGIAVGNRHAGEATSTLNAISWMLAALLENQLGIQ